MKTTFRIALALMIFAAVPVVAHHMAEGILDEELYDMIDAAVANTPHAELDFTSIGGRTEITIEAGNLMALENLVDTELISMVGMLDGQVTMDIEFTETRTIYVTIVQLEEETDKVIDEAFFVREGITLDGIKVLYR